MKTVGTSANYIYNLFLCAGSKLNSPKCIEYPFSNFRSANSCDALFISNGTLNRVGVVKSSRGHLTFRIVQELEGR